MKLLDRFLRIIVKAQPTLVLHDQNNADEEETVVGSSGNARTGVSIAVYKPREFDASNPVYEVETWDADDNMTERMVNISEVDPADCDEVEMTAYTWYLSNSGKCPAAFLLFAGAREHRQTSRPGYSSDSVFEFLGQALAPTSGKTVAPPADTSLIYKRSQGRNTER